MTRMSWRGVYVLSFLVYLALNAIVTSTMGLGVRDVALFAISNTIAPAFLGILVVRHFRAERGALHHFLFGTAFAVVAVASTLFILWVGRGAELFRLRADSTLWALIIEGLIFVGLASVTRVQRVQSELAAERERVAAAEASRARAELAALRARIDPHFLFNTLHSLLALVRQDPSRAEDAIEQFADILRYTFAAGDGSEERTLQQEWQLVDNYLALERLRLGERLRVNQFLDPAAAGAPVPVLTLQPIVENAVRHAIAPRAGGGRIEIRAMRVESGVRIEVSDDGPGVSPDALATTRGTGLQLVRERLERMYRGAATMTLEPAAAGGVCVSIVLPFEDE